jgi:hypothetical protein
MTGAYEVAHYGHFFLWEMLSLVKTNPKATFQSFSIFPTAGTTRRKTNILIRYGLPLWNEREK